MRVAITLEERFWNKVDRRGEDDCWPWIGGSNRGGYGAIGAPVDGAWRTMTAPRLSLMLAQKCDDPGPKVLCLHSCDNPACVNPSHLRWGTQKDNVQDAVTRDRGIGKGDKSGPRAKRPHLQSTSALSETQAREVMALRVSGLKNAEIARRTGVSYNVVADIARGRSYAFLHGIDGAPTKEDLIAAGRGNKSISDETAAEFMRARANGEGTRAAAARLGIPEAVASDIARGRGYSHLHGRDGLPDLETLRAGGTPRGHNWKDMHG